MGNECFKFLINEKFFLRSFSCTRKKTNKKKAPVSRALRVRLRVAIAAGRVGTRCAQAADASSSPATAMLGLVTKG